jgi:hypothetical protein
MPAAVILLLQGGSDSGKIKIRQYPKTAFNYLS